MRLALLPTCALVLAIAACDDRPKSTPAAASASAPAATASAPPPAPTPEPAPTSSAPPTQILCQHVLIAFKEAKKPMRGVTRSREAARARAETVLSLARKDPQDFDDLVRIYSDDYSKERNGTTGAIKREDVVKPFADAAFALRIGQVSGIVETPFGFHVIKRNQ